MKKWYDTKDVEKGPCLSDDELVEIEEFARRRNDDLLEKLLKDRLFWIRSCAHADTRLNVALQSGMAFLDGGKRKRGWVKIKCFVDAVARVTVQPFERPKTAYGHSESDRIPIGFNSTKEPTP